MSQKNNKSRNSANDSTKGGQPKKQSAPAPKKRTGLYIGIAAVLVIGGIAIATAGGGNGAGPKAPVQPSAEEAAYLGRLLPAGYQAATVAEPTVYDSRLEMTELPGTLGETELTVPVADVVDAKIALLQYQPEGASDALPLIAYVKPSGELFVGISFCPPCQGEWQAIESDGTLTCNSCGTKRDLETQAGISGTCKLYPLDELPATIVDGNITIDRAVLDSWTPQPLDRQVG